MATHDTLGDFLTIVRNGSRAGLKSVSAQWSSIREGVARILKESGYIEDFKKEDKNNLPVLEIVLKYNGKTPVITSINRVSKPGRRVYSGYDDIPKVIGGMGISILTTSKGILSDVEARRQKVGGEILARVW
ncbi:MAG: 30S ribosomal protein S8 [Opitutae bacterium]|nr:30S ribosomal protein S8 [Opitutae bacterium]MCD8298420.1 30S ribosomal protein S8 [Opitutae bacterium]